MTTSTETTIHFNGKSGREYKFWIHPLGTSFKDSPGVYGWLKETQPGTFRPVYFGQSKSLSDRHGNHEKEAEVKRNGATHICAHMTSGTEAERLAEEKDLIENYKPVCNDIFN
jgi:excinuclease UvrABC nuclease subunit